jgi:putative Ca2+/H+ antiporter (TMEM165/GDT1 family)
MDDDQAPAEGGSAFLVTAAAFFFAEFGDKTQVATLMLAARYDNLIAVVCGTTLGMLCADAPAVALGTALPFALPLRAVRLAAAALFGALGAAALLGFSPF